MNNLYKKLVFVSNDTVFGTNCITHG